MNDDEDDVRHESADDALEETRAGGMFHPATDEEQLPEDNDTPFSPPDDAPGPAVPSTHQLNDTDNEAEDIYDQGLSEASGQAERHIGPDTRPRSLEPEDDA